MIRDNINSPLTSSAGRLFDAVAAITGICTHAQYHAEAPMKLESVIDHACKEEYEFEIGQTIGLKKLIAAIAEDVLNKKPVPVISAKFHNTIISIIFAVVCKMREQSGIGKVVLSGGVFQNKYITESVNTVLAKNKFEVFIPSEVPCNDGGIALGQLYIAAKRRTLLRHDKS
jgi:hydrogenase maturation protein HypF